MTPVIRNIFKQCVVLDTALFKGQVMSNPFWHVRSIRTRLFIAYLSIILTGFAALTLIAGQQISSSARADYEKYLVNTARLISQGVRPFVTDADTTGDISEELAQIIDEYEADTNIEITFFRPSENFNSETQDFQGIIPPNRDGIQGVELDGELYLYTAHPIFEDNRRGRSEQGTVNHQTDSEPILENETQPAFLLGRVPSANLNAIIIQRWGALWLIFLLVAVLTLFASAWVAQSIIRPLYNLRDSAVLLSQGDFSHQIKDVTSDEIGEVAQAFNEMAQQVESMLIEQRAFASNTSHELRTPLTTIRLRSEALRYESLDENTTRTYIEDIDNEVIRMATLIEDLTLLSRFDAKRAELGQSEIDMTRFAQNLIRTLQRQASEKNIQLSFSVDDTIPSIISSLNHMNIIFRNILENALKYTDDKGVITWEISSYEAGILSSIQDNGEGIESEHLHHLFERFYRADQAHSRDVPGTGLGLSLVKSILEAYGGWIKIDSDGKNKGTSVQIYLPSRGK